MSLWPLGTGRTAVTLTHETPSHGHYYLIPSRLPVIRASRSHLPQNITLSAKEMVNAAEASVRTLSIEEALALHGQDDVIFIDLRDIRELAKTGRVSGARHVPRGLLEFWIDPATSYHKPFFTEDKTFVFYCAGGLRSALAAKVAQEMGLSPVAHIAGGMAAWLTANGPIETLKQN